MRVEKALQDEIGVVFKATVVFECKCLFVGIGQVLAGSTFMYNNKHFIA